MVRTSVPCSRRWTAKACLKECGVMGLEILQIRWTFWHSCSTAERLMCWPGMAPGKSQCSGLSTRHHSRRICNSLGGEHHVAIFHAFALLHPQDHALAVDGGEGKSDGFGNAQACCVAGGQDG